MVNCVRNTLETWVMRSDESSVEVRKSEPTYGILVSPIDSQVLFYCRRYINENSSKQIKIIFYSNTVAKCIDCMIRLLIKSLFHISFDKLPFTAALPLILTFYGFTKKTISNASSFQAKCIRKTFNTSPRTSKS